jgi:hypothetical protein
MFYKLAQNNGPPILRKSTRKRRRNQPSTRISCSMHQLMGVYFCDFYSRAKTSNLICICSSDATKLGERVEFYCNGKELRAAPRQTPRACIGAALRLYAISFEFVARNHRCVLVSFCCSVPGGGMPPCGRAGLGPKKTRGAICTSYSASVLLPDRRRAGSSGGCRAAGQFRSTKNGVALYFVLWHSLVPWFQPVDPSATNCNRAVNGTGRHYIYAHGAIEIQYTLHV